MPGNGRGVLVEEVSPKIIFIPKDSTLITYPATLDVSRELALYVSGLLAAERRRRGTPRGSRKLTCYWQAVLGLRWFRDRTAIDALGRDHGISRATAYRYVGEVFACDRCREDTLSVKGEVIDLWYSGKAHEHGGNVQAVTLPGGFPIWL